MISVQKISGGVIRKVKVKYQNANGTMKEKHFDQFAN